MKNLIGYLLTGIRLKLLIRLLRQNKVSYYPLYVIRMLSLFQNACWSSFFAMKDRLKWNKDIMAHPRPDDPVFIIGHWRTGSTYLHQLLNLHELLAAPTLFQTSQPEGYMKARRYYGAIMKMILGKKRPFDQLKIGIDEVQEDEFALFRMTGNSPLKMLIFPESPGYFLLKNECCFNLQGDEGRAWDQSLKYFYRKVSWSCGRRLVLKNPFHSMRIPYLRREFPGAKFIHIFRNPCDVVPSTLKMWRIVGKHNAMNRRWRPPFAEEVVKFYALMQKEIHGRLSEIPAENHTGVRFEDLERDPIGEMKRICGFLKIEFTPEFETRINEFLKANADFEKNHHHVDDTLKQLIREKMIDYNEEFGY